eukprot:352594-Chlamydomonas_euryale.AAC.5
MISRVSIDTAPGRCCDGDERGCTLQRYAALRSIVANSKSRAVKAPRSTPTPALRPEPGRRSYSNDCVLSSRDPDRARSVTGLLRRRPAHRSAASDGPRWLICTH